MATTSGLTKALAVLALLASGLGFHACSDNRLEGGVGGTGGQGGAGAGSGSGSAPCDKGGTVLPEGSQCAGLTVTGNIAQGMPCDTDGVWGTADDLACWNTCGPNRSGTRSCTCVGGLWNCPRTCNYDISDPSKFDCFKTAGFEACPPDPSDPSGMLLPASGGACTLPPCRPCGSTTAPAYRDSSGAPKVGWCVCVTPPGGTTSGYTCAPVADWAPQCQ